ncbi:MAG TPA: DUF6636 domain-containing protein [Longimicrobium sp.]
MPIRLSALAAAVVAALGLGPAPDAGQSHSFRTPSGNIACMAAVEDDGGWTLRCDIAMSQRSWEGGSAGEECDLDDGDSLGLNATGRAYWVCHGDTVLGPGAPTLSYGSTWSVGPFTCTVERTGVTCRNRSRHGFTLSRTSYRIL